MLARSCLRPVGARAILAQASARQVRIARENAGGGLRRLTRPAFNWGRERSAALCIWSARFGYWPRPTFLSENSHFLAQAHSVSAGETNIFCRREGTLCAFALPGTDWATPRKRSMADNAVFSDIGISGGFSAHQS